MRLRAPRAHSATAGRRGWRAPPARTASPGSRIDSRPFYTSSATNGSRSSAPSPSSTRRGRSSPTTCSGTTTSTAPWIPFTVPTDEEIVWVGYDPSGAPTDIWTYWHGKMLHADWRGRGTPAIDVQWGKHGLLPRGIIESDLPRFQTLNSFYAFHQLGLPRHPARPHHPAGTVRLLPLVRAVSRLLARRCGSADSLDVVVRSDEPAARSRRCSARRTPKAPLALSGCGRPRAWLAATSPGAVGATPDATSHSPGPSARRRRRGRVWRCL